VYIPLVTAVVVPIGGVVVFSVERKRSN
jgi:hypothetical protein